MKILESVLAFILWLITLVGFWVIIYLVNNTPDAEFTAKEAYFLGVCTLAFYIWNREAADKW